MRVNNFVDSIVAWRKVISDAKSQLQNATGRRRQQLEDVVAMFTRKMESGEVWPGLSATQN